MSGHSFQSSVVSHASKKAPALDIAPSQKYSRRVSASAFPGPARPTPLVSRKGMDGIRGEHRSFLLELQERSAKDSFFRFLRRSQLYFRRGRRLLASAVPDLSPRKMLYGSLTAGVAFGMVSMALMAHYLGAGVFARTDAPAPMVVESKTETPAKDAALSVGGYDPEQDVFFEYFGQVTKEKYEGSIRDMVKGYPIEEMLPYIFAEDRLTAAFLIGIAKKESNWGKRIPVLDGQDCFNYWGYRGVRRMMGSGGHTCFNSRKDAVETVANRLEKLIESEKLDTPEKMIVWKCGFSCQGHSRESVKKWISDVDMYFSQLNDE